MSLSEAQIKTLRELAPEGTHLARGMFGNVCANLAKKGLVEFVGYKAGLREFRLTKSGRAALAVSES